MEKSVELKVFAKINLSLNILGKEGDLHLLDMIVASIDIYDAISISPRSDDIINVEIDEPSIDRQNNSVTKALNAVKSAIGSFGCDIVVCKNIPIMAGLGGSSADAAGTILALDQLLDLQKRGCDPKKLAKATGSDTVYMLEGGYKRIKGTGEIIERIPAPHKPLNLIIALPSKGCSTAETYKQFDRLHKDCKHSPADNERLIKALAAYDLKALAAETQNALFAPAISLCPEIRDVLEMVKKQHPVAAFMTGSGSGVVGIFGSDQEATTAAKNLQRAGIKSMATKTNG